MCASPTPCGSGPEGEGWRVAITTLMNERIALSGAGSLSGDAVGGSAVDKLIARHHPDAPTRSSDSGSRSSTSRVG